MDLALFSILDIGKQRYEVAASGITKGLATTLVPPDCNEIIRQRIERDKVHRGATRKIKLDCLDCGACCYSNRVVLSKKDVERFREGGREKFTKPPYTKRSNGQLVLKLAPDKACLHLGHDNRCGVYTVRPEMCRDFPMASECCLSARAEEFDIYDGAHPS